MLPKPEQAASGAERRRFPRVDLDVAVELVGPEGGVWSLKSANISRSGLQVRCPREAARDLVKECRRAAPSAADGHLGVRLGLEGTAGTSKRLTARARIVYARPGPEDHYLIGLEFAGFEGDGYESLQAYIMECLRY